MNQCLKCRYSWLPIFLKKSQRCPKCRAYNWDGRPDGRANNKGATRRNRATKWGWEKMAVGDIKEIPLKLYQPNKGAPLIPDDFFTDSIFRSMWNYGFRSKKQFVAIDSVKNNIRIKRLK